MSGSGPERSAWGWLVLDRAGMWSWVAFGPPGRTSGQAATREEARAAADSALVQLRLMAVVRDGAD